MQSRDEEWRLFLGSRDDFTSSVEASFGFVMHDAAHDYYQADSADAGYGDHAQGVSGGFGPE
jgi:hypothetical protein